MSLQGQALSGFEKTFLLDWQKVRAKNNKNWMDLYRLAFKIAPDESVKIIKKILSKDMTVSNLAKKLIK